MLFIKKEIVVIRSQKVVQLTGDETVQKRQEHGYFSPAPGNGACNLLILQL